MKRLVIAAVAALGLAGSASAAPITYEAVLSGAAENPANASPGTGTATVIIDTVAHTLDLQVVFASLVGITTAAHIHCCVDAPDNVGVAIGSPGFPLAATSGNYNNSFDTTLAGSFAGGFLAANLGTAAGAEAALAAGLAAGRAYFNIHTSVLPGGEIRGFFTPKRVPEPASLALLGLGLAGAAIRRRRAR